MFLVMTIIAFLPIERDLSVNTYEFQLSHERASEVSERAREWSKRAKRCGASERSEQCERTNVASDRVALTKRDCHE